MSDPADDGIELEQYPREIRRHAAQVYKDLWFGEVHRKADVAIIAQALAAARRAAFEACRDEAMRIAKVEPKINTVSACATCGMPCAAQDYHPYAACLMFLACHDSRTVRANLQGVVEHGRKKTEEAR